MRGYGTVTATISALFSGIGLLKNHQVKLHIDEGVKPVAQPHRRVPFHIRKRVENEIQLLLDQDIIERAVGPTQWISPIVIAKSRITQAASVYVLTCEQRIQRFYEKD